MSMRVSEDFQDEVQAKIDAVATGKFFQQKRDARIIPSFDIGGVTEESAATSEIITGDELGSGAFCVVKEITSITLVNDATSEAHESEKVLDKASSSGDKPEKDQKPDEDPLGSFKTKSEVRRYMSDSCQRTDDSDGTKHARYAIKVLKTSNNRKDLETGLKDISIECQFLRHLGHSNICKMRGTAGIPLSPSFGIILDRLYQTLESKMNQWMYEAKQFKSAGCLGCLGLGKLDPVWKKRQHVDAITVASDISSALRYIHSNDLVYRDLKPENAGFDVRGNIKIFDFGFCKELSKKLLDKKTGMYKLTRCTGSLPYMAPEVFEGKLYGKGADVFSYGVLLYEMLNFKYAFTFKTLKDYKDIIIDNKYRPSIDGAVAARPKDLIKETWDQDPKKRPNFDRISIILKSEYYDSTSELESRSERLSNITMKSIRLRRKK